MDVCIDRCADAVDQLLVDIWCCGQLWVSHMICGQTCDELYHFTFLLDCFGIPLGFQPIKSALARHSGVQVPVIFCHEGPWSFWINHRARFVIFGRKRESPFCQFSEDCLIIQTTCQSILVPSSSYLRVYMGCALAFVLQVPVTWSTLKGQFRGVPSLRLYS